MRLGVIGAGQATATLLAELCRGGFDGEITVFHDEPGAPCPRPPLSKTPFDHTLSDRDKTLIPEPIAQDARIRWVYERVTAIEPDVGRISTATIEVQVDHIVIATGTRAKRPVIYGLDDQDLHVLRTLADRERLSDALADCQSVALIGAGFMAYEIAASLPRDLRVTILARGPRGLPQVSDAIAQRLIAQSPARTLTDCDRIQYRPHRLINQGIEVPADCVIATVGAAPNVDLLLPHGLADADGVPVDGTMQSPHPKVSAIGEVARHPSADGTGEIRIESISEANDTATVLAKRLLGSPTPWSATPWFWSDQGTEKLQIAGLAQRTDDALCLSDEADSVVVLRSQGDHVTAVEALNAAREFMAARRLLERGPVSVTQVRQHGSLMALLQSSSS